MAYIMKKRKLYPSRSRQYTSSDVRVYLFIHRLKPTVKMMAMTFLSFHTVSPGQRRETFSVSPGNDFSTAIYICHSFCLHLFFKQGSVCLFFLLRWFLIKNRLHPLVVQCSNSVVVDYTWSDISQHPLDKICFWPGLLVPLWFRRSVKN